MGEGGRGGRGEGRGRGGEGRERGRGRAGEGGERGKGRLGGGGVGEERVGERRRGWERGGEGGERRRGRERSRETEVENTEQHSREPPNQPSSPESHTSPEQIIKIDRDRERPDRQNRLSSQ